jgi:hypothetical protein
MINHIDHIFDAYETAVMELNNMPTTGKNEKRAEIELSIKVFSAAIKILVENQRIVFNTFKIGQRK